jgi:GAF domain-containing protein
MSEQPSLDGALATIEHQAREIERLRQQVSEEEFVVELREALIASAAAGVIAAPVTHSRLLELIVETAAQVIAANAASLFLIDEDTEELVFAVALGGKAEEVKNLRIPLGHGIAGLVAASGQPMAISDAQSDPRQASDSQKAPAIGQRAFFAYLCSMTSRSSACWSCWTSKVRRRSVRKTWKRSGCSAIKPP